MSSINQRATYEEDGWVSVNLITRTLRNKYVRKREKRENVTLPWAGHDVDVVTLVDPRDEADTSIVVVFDHGAGDNAPIVLR